VPEVRTRPQAAERRGGKNIETYIVNQTKISAVTLAPTMRATLGKSQSAIEAQIRSQQI